PGPGMRSTGVTRPRQIAYVGSCPRAQEHPPLPQVHTTRASRSLACLIVHSFLACSPSSVASRGALAKTATAVAAPQAVHKAAAQDKVAALGKLAAPD